MTQNLFMMQTSSSFPTKFVDLLGIRIVLRLKKYAESVYPVKDSDMKYTFHPDKGTL